MSKKILSLLLAMAMFAVTGPFEVFALNEETDSTDVSGESITSETVETTETPEAPAVTEEPVVTTSGAYSVGVYADNVTETSADISWDAIDDAYLYELIYSGSEPIEIAAPETTFSLTDLETEENYIVTIRAYDGEDSLISEGAVEFYTEKAPVVTKAPKKVKKFRTISSYQSIVLKWKKSTDADGYKIYWKGSNGKKGTIRIKSKKTTSYKFKIAEEDREVKYTFRIAAVKNGVASEKVTKKDSAVQLMRMQITLKVSKELKNHDRPEGKYTIKLKAGTKIDTIGFTNGKYVFRKKVKGKFRTFHVMRIAARNQKITYIGKYKKSKGWKIVQPIYTKDEAEDFINALGVKSNTKYLIWVNQYSQRLYIFKSNTKGKKKDWKLLKNCYKDEDDGHAGWPVASGKPTSPTSTGLTSIKQRDLGGGGKVPFWNVTTWFSIHGNSPGPWGPLGWPKSGACCRNTTPHAKWIYYNTPMRTSVYVY
ncbi:MAG: hypothetical protein IJJ06_09495 [Mogibacterium sp.]|nr:hypothetical protein [Mogibacterium sp.]